MLIGLVGPIGTGKGALAKALPLSTDIVVLPSLVRNHIEDGFAVGTDATPYSQLLLLLETYNQADFNRPTSHFAIAHTPLDVLAWSFWLQENSWALTSQQKNKYFLHASEIARKGMQKYNLLYLFTVPSHGIVDDKLADAWSKTISLIKNWELDVTLISSDAPLEEQIKTVAFGCGIEVSPSLMV